MANKEDFGVDIILSSLQELQKERVQNERTLAELCGQRKQLEVELERATGSLKTVQDKNTMMTELVRVAEKKVAHSQAQVEMLEHVNGEHRANISKLNQSISNMEVERQKHFVDYEAQMTALTDRFRTAWKCHSSESLGTELEKIKEQKSQLRDKSVCEGRLCSLQSSVEQARRPQEEREGGGARITEETWKIVVAMFEEGRDFSMKAVERARGKVSQLSERKAALAMELAGLLRGEEEEEEEEEEGGGHPHGE